MSSIDLHRIRGATPLWAAYLALGAVVVVGHALLETGSLTQSFVYDIIGASAVVMAVVGVRVNRPDRALPWLLMAAGQGLFVAGDLAWNWYEIIGEDPFPSVADVLYLAGYPFIAVGLFFLIRRRIGDGDRGGLLDAAILTTAVAILSWTFFIQPLVAVTDVDPLSMGISLAYPLADLLLIGVALGLLTTPGARTLSFRFLLLSLVLLLVGDQIYAIQTLDETYVSGGPVDSVYLFAYLLFGASVLHPSMRRLTEPQPVAVTWLGPARLVCLAAAMVTGPILVTVGPEAQEGLLVVAAGTALLSLLVLARLAGLVGLLASDVAQRRILEEQLSYQAFHDPLTGMANRRWFVEQAGRALAERPTTGTLAALFLDLDDFKTVNDSLGHAAGDELLVVVGERIRGTLRTTDLAARLGGDEFGILLVDIPDAAYASTIAERMLKALDGTIAIAGTAVTVGASIGIAIDHPEMRSVDDLLSEADIAMYQAKALGKGRLHVFARGTTAEPAPTKSAERSWLGRRPTVRRTALGGGLSSGLSSTPMEPEAG